MKELNKKVYARSIFLAVVLGLLLFVPAGTIFYWQAWLYLIIFFGASTIITIYLMKNDPELLERRLKAGPGAETERSQKIIMLIVTIAYTAMFLISSIDYRFRWSNVPFYTVIHADLLIIVGFYVIFLVFKENTFTSATIKIHKDQRVISTGPYAFVRHPMYSGSLIMLIPTAPAVGSWWGLLAVIPIILAIIWRLLDEEKFLIKNLPGYKEYCSRVVWRLIPGIF